MTTWRAAMMVSIFAAGAWAGVEGRSKEYKVTVCTAMDHDFVVERADSIAAKMFAEIGVQIDWHSNRPCPPDAIRIIYTDCGSRKFPPDALAYALPYESRHIEVFNDRLRTHPARGLPILLAHVLVHEITHVLQGVPRHSLSGIMRARWSTEDYNEMIFRPLRFTAADVDLIRLGIEAREARLVAARN